MSSPKGKILNSNTKESLKNDNFKTPKNKYLDFSNEKGIPEDSLENYVSPNFNIINIGFTKKQN